MTRIAIALLLLLTGCIAPTEEWRHLSGEKASDLQLQRDKSDCHMYIDASRQESSVVLQKHPVFEWEDEFVQCMAERGWHLERVH